MAKPTPEDRFFVGIASRPVRDLHGVSARRAELLAKLGITTWLELASFFPREYEDWSTIKPLNQLEDGAEQAFVASVARAPQVQRRGRLSWIRTVLRDEQSAVAAIWFNQPWLANRLEVGQSYRFYGRIRRDGKQFSVQNPAFEPLEQPAPDADRSDMQQQAKSRLRPIYPLTAGLTQGVMRQLISTVLPPLTEAMPDPLPPEIRRAHRLCAASYAYSRIHQPEHAEELEICRRRLSFEELFLLRCGLSLLRTERVRHATAWPLPDSDAARTATRQLLDSLPFTLTDAQQRAWSEISADLALEQPMNRLLQGDVGSGKTVPAALAMQRCAVAGAQAALMAPTAILARQHYQTLTQLLADSGYTVALLTAATPAPERRRILADLASGELQLVVGTHALLETAVAFHRLALAITDEQHRFGVRQRIRLGSAQGALSPHVLVMSATPIPRSLALILYGDLDLSVIDQMPPGRQPIETYTATSIDRPRVESLIRRQVEAGRQVYVVCPMIEEQEESDLESAEQTYQRLSQDVFPDLSVGLIHGRLRQSAKDEAMDAFISGRTQILVSTTVIEVGIDNPNATLMLIENAGRFGLAQLHQLRGRIGRGAHRSICVLLSDSEDALVRARLRAICQHRDGYAVAEKDLELRGPGDFFGTRQHGLPPLRIANLYRDHELLRETQAAVSALISADPDFTQPANALIRRMLKARFGDVFAEVGL